MCFIEPSTCNFSRSSTFYFPDSQILNHRIIVASFEEKGSKSAQGDKNVAILLSISELGWLHLFSVNLV
jgi:hypothetical protein